MSFDALISADALRAHLRDPQWRIFDCRHDLADPAAGEKAYADGHVPGAQFLHLDRDLSGEKNGRNGRHPLPDRDALVRRLGDAGVSRSSQVVVYDDAGGAFAARLWWLLRWLGHAQVAVLDGGWQAWRDAGGPIANDTPRPAPTSFEAGAALVRSIDADTVAAQLAAPRFVLVDARAPERYRGEVEPLDAVAGHIPGAINRFYRDNLDAGGRFKPARALREEWTRLLGEHASSSVHYCGSGVTSCHNLLAMRVAGLPDASLYVGSWSEWCSDPRRPVAKGDAKNAGR